MIPGTPGSSILSGLYNWQAGDDKLTLLRGGFGVFLALIALYSRVERKRYDARQAKIARGEIQDDLLTNPDEEDASCLCFGRTWLGRTLYHFRKGLTTKHNWIAAVYPSGKKVYPKRLLKVLVLLSTTSLAFGSKYKFCSNAFLIYCLVNAVFAYTTHVNAVPGEPNTVNTAVVFGQRIPLIGFYSFLIMLPLIMTLSIAFGYYSAYIEILRKVAPIRFRAMTPIVRHEFKRLGLEVDPLDRPARKKA